MAAPPRPAPVCVCVTHCLRSAAVQSTCLRPHTPHRLPLSTAVKQKIRDYGYMHMQQWEVLLSITAKAMLAAEVSWEGVDGGRHRGLVRAPSTPL
jgi:hypothetical protein